MIQKMSNFLKKGFRKKQVKEKKLTKKHIKEFYKILAELEEIAIKVDKDFPNIKEGEELNTIVEKNYLGRKLDKTELTILESKIYTKRVKDGKEK